MGRKAGGEDAVFLEKERFMFGNVDVKLLHILWQNEFGEVESIASRIAGSLAFYRGGNKWEVVWVWVWGGQLECSNESYSFRTWMMKYW